MRGSGAGECLRPVDRSRERGAAAHIRRRRAHIAHTRVAPYPLTSYRRALLVVPHYVDLHSHYLPALDDGATNLEMSLQMMRAITALGFTHLYATPHQRDGMFMPERAKIDAAFAAVKTAVGGVA